MSWAGLNTIPRVLMRRLPLVTLFLISALTVGRPSSEGDSQNLKLLVSIEQQTITEPYPARVTLHLHNAGQEAIWLYRRARGPRPAAHYLTEVNRPPETTGGSVLEAKLQPVTSAGPREAAVAASATVFENVGLPRPKLERIAPGDDYEEKTLLRLAPALGESQKAIWG